MPTYIIAGIDPGNTYGIAILSLGGRKLAAHSTDAGMAEAVRIIERHGTPSLIACDVYPAPEAAQKIASYFSCRLFSPSRDIREEEKRQIAQGALVKNNHERDAYSAAVLAFRSHQNKLRQIEALPELTSEEKGKLSHLVLRGYKLKDAFLEFREPEGKDDGKGHRTQLKQPEGRTVSLEELRARVSLLARENANLRLMLSRLENERAQLEGRLRLFENELRRSILRDSEIRRLRFQLQKSLERFQPKEKRQTHEKPRERQQPRPVSTAENDDLNSLGNPKLDLEKMVTDYRRGRKQ